jgi:subtilisin family serine protease
LFCHRRIPQWEEISVDPALIQILRTGKPRDEVAVLVRLERGVVPRRVRVVSQFGDIATVRVARGDIPFLHAEEGVRSVKAQRLYSPDWVQTTGDIDDEIDVRSSDERRPRGLTYTGRGVVTALIDWGLDVAHPDFRNADGSSRVLALWDQRVRHDGRCNNRYGYGWVHERAAINRSLRNSDPYSEIGYSPYSTSRGPTHGTHTAGILAGNGRSGGPVGMAPEADVVFVHLADPLSAIDANLGSSVALQEGIDFIARVAGDRPWVLNLSLGRHAGPHDGSTLVEQGIDAALAAPGRACIQSTGNYLSRPIHVQLVLRPGEIRDISFHTGEENNASHELDLWYAGRDRIIVELITPSGQSAGWCRTGEESAMRKGSAASSTGGAIQTTMTTRLWSRY